MRRKSRGLVANVLDDFAAHGRGTWAAVDSKHALLGLVAHGRATNAQNPVDPSEPEFALQEGEHELEKSPC